MSLAFLFFFFLPFLWSSEDKFGLFKMENIFFSYEFLFYGEKGESVIGDILYLTSP